jgi:hypothetical protein
MYNVQIEYRGFNMNGKIFLLKNDNELIEMEEREYPSELILQELVADYPNLLAGYEMDEENPRKWLLVKKEQELYSPDEGSNVVYLDHLLLDQDGVPTLVEVKRSSDTRIRREVVGQMVDYASNAVVYLQVEEMIANVNLNFPDLDMAEILCHELGFEGDPDEFWGKVKTNLQAGKVRMVFLADIIPPELRRMVEFLNEQMDPAEAFAVEVKQYVGEGLKTLVPRLIGQTAEAQKKRIISNKLDESIFFENLDDNGIEFYRALMKFAGENQLKIIWGTKGFSLNVVLGGNNVSILRGYCKLSAYDQTAFVTFSSILSKVPDGDMIIEQYRSGLDDVAVKVSDGYRLDVDEMDKKQLGTFYEVLTRVVGMIKNS